MKILMITYYGLREALLGAANSLRKLGYEVIDFPLFMYLHDVNLKKDNYLELFINTIEKENPNFILWWYIGIPYDAMQVIYNKFNHPLIYFNT